MLFWLLGCTISKPLPNLGDCATYPSEGYDYGTIEIGSCVSGATDLAFREADDGSWYLLTSNANPYVNFANGSLLSIAWNSIDTNRPINYSHELESTPLALPSFAGNLAFTNDDIAMVGVRYSEDSRTRTDADDVYLIDISDPSTPLMSTRGTNGTGKLEVSSDPVDIVLDTTTNLGFVGNRTSHDISVINIARDPMQIIPPWPLEVLGEATFIDSDDSGSRASLSRLETLPTYYGESLDTEELESLNGLTDDFWTLDWIEGTWDIWVPEETGYQRLTSVNATDFTMQGLGNELGSIESLLGQEITDLFIWGAEAYFTMNGEIGVASWNAQEYEWQLRDNSILSLEGGTLSSPTLMWKDTELQMMLAAADETGSWVARATQDAGGNWRLDNTMIAPDDGTVVDVTAVEEFGINQWRMFATVESDDSVEIRQWRSSDAESWTPASTIANSMHNIGAPVVSEESDRFRMWYSIEDNGLWDIAYAESIDGEYWEDFGIVLTTGIDSDTPPKVGMQATPMSAFRLEGESAGYQGTVEVGETALLETQGWALTVSVGQWLDTDLFGANSAGGLYIAQQLDTISVIAMTDASGVGRVGYLTETGEQGLWVEPSDAVTSIESPVLWEQNNVWNLAYAAVNEQEQSSIVAQTSSDNGATWSERSTLIEPHDDWASMRVEPTDWTLLNDTPTLIYAGTDDKTWELGLSQWNGDSWSTASEPWFDLGRPGNWDDSGVRDAKLQFENDGYRIWYSGFDGERWRIGSALQDAAIDLVSLNSDDWERSETSSVDSGWFHLDGARHPLPAYSSANEQWFIYYGGIAESVTRVGHAIGSSPWAMRTIYRYPTLGDQITFETTKGDEEGNTIPLESSVTDTTTFGIGLTDLSLDTDRGFLYASSKLMPHIAVIDIRDDSQGDFVDRNYLDEEARIVLPTSMGSAGFRQVLPHPNGKEILAIGDSPEAVFIIDMSEVEDDATSDRIYDIQNAWLPLPVGGEDDAGERTRTSMGPGTMVLDPLYNRLFVSNFNANSVTVFDLSVGNGIQIAEFQSMGENPYAMTLTPDGHQLVVSNYTGDLVEDVAHSTLSIFDVNPASTTKYTLQTQVVNR